MLAKMAVEMGLISDVDLSDFADVLWLEVQLWCAGVCLGPVTEAMPSLAKLLQRAIR